MTTGEKTSCGTTPLEERRSMGTGTGPGRRHGCTFQISLAYSAMVRSDEKKPVPAVESSDMRDHFIGSRYLEAS